MKIIVDDCPLCGEDAAGPFSSDKLRRYLQCSTCELIFVPRNELIDPEAEKDRYSAHENHEQDPQYLNYLQKIADQIIPHISEKSRGLDFGCGKTTLLANLLSSNRFIDSFDLFFHNDPQVWSRNYDFIVLSEVIEHLRNPIEEMKKLCGLLNPGGKFFIKTKFSPSEKKLFDQWFYKRDITHIQFFNPVTMNKLSSLLGMEDPEYLGDDLTLIRSS